MKNYRRHFTVLRQPPALRQRRQENVAIMGPRRPRGRPRRRNQNAPMQQEPEQRNVAILGPRRPRGRLRQRIENARLEHENRQQQQLPQQQELQQPLPDPLEPIEQELVERGAPERNSELELIQK